jgi:hypothetical protein
MVTKLTRMPSDKSHMTSNIDKKALSKYHMTRRGVMCRVTDVSCHVTDILYHVTCVSSHMTGISSHMTRVSCL